MWIAFQNLENEMAEHGMREPNWPSWVSSTFTTEGMQVLESSLVELKTSGNYERGSRMSAADHATAVAAFLRTIGRHDLFKKRR